MRYTLWFTLGFAAACIGFAYFLPAGALLILGIFLLTAGICGMFFFREVDAKRKVAVSCLGLAVGLLYCAGVDAARLAPLRKLDGQDKDLTVTVTDYQSKEKTRTYVPATTELSGKAYSVLLYLYDGLDLQPGDQIHGNFYLRYTATGGSLDPGYYSVDGYYLLLFPNEISDPIPGQESGQYLPAKLRHQLVQILDAAFPSDTAPFAKALLLGHTDELTYQDDTALKISGIRHVVAVSGLHVSILYSLVYLFALHKKKLTALLGIPILCLFAAVAGFTPSVVRACIMQGIMMISQVIRKEQDPPTSLSIAVLVMLAVNPFTVASVGFQLSVASVVGIFTLYKRISDRLMDSVWTELCWKKPVVLWIMRYVIGSLSVSLSASIFTVPLCAYYFGMVSLIGIITNLLCMWSITFLFCGIILVCVAGLAWMPLASGIAWVLSWLIRGILLLAEALSKVPLAVVYTQNVGVILWLIVSYGILIVFLVHKWNFPGNPIWYSAILLLAVVLITWLRPMAESYRATLLDVGQGQCVVLQSEGRTFLVDCGGSSDEKAANTAVAYLANQGVRTVDGLIITHYDRDHAGGAALLMSRLRVQTLYLPNAADGGDIEKALLAAPHDQTVRVSEDMHLRWQETDLQIFAPKAGKTGNESSLCVLFQKEKCDILITGDLNQAGELELLQRYSLPKLEYLIAGHHGAASSTGTALLAACDPETVLISVGANNRYGHPSAELLQQLAQFHIPVYRTDQEGTIIISEVSLWLRNPAKRMQAVSVLFSS